MGCKQLSLKQREALEAFMSGRDAFISFPTGYVATDMFPQHFSELQIWLEWRETRSMHKSYHSTAWTITRTVALIAFGFTISCQAAMYMLLADVSWQ